MKMIWLRAFLAVVKHKNFSEAADELFVSQSTLSKYIKLLEEELSISLFDRSTRNVQVTEAGQALIPYATSIMEQYTALQEAMADFRESSVRTMRIVSVPFLHLYNISDQFIQFQRRFPNIKLELFETEMFEALRNIDDPATSFCILRSSFIQHLHKNVSYHVFPFISDELVFLCHRDHPLAAQSRIPISACLSERLVVMSLGFQEYRRTFHELGINPEQLRPFLKCASTSTLVKMISENMAVSFAVQGIARQLCEGTQIVMRPFVEHPAYSLDIVARRESLTSASSLLIEQLLRSVGRTE